MNVDAFLSTLPIMAKGMCGIFVVTLVIILIIWLLNKTTSGKQKKETEEK